MSQSTFYRILKITVFMISRRFSLLFAVLMQLHPNNLFYDSTLILSFYNVLSSKDPSEFPPKFVYPFLLSALFLHTPSLLSSLVCSLWRHIESNNNHKTPNFVTFYNYCIISTNKFQVSRKVWWAILFPHSHALFRRFHSSPKPSVSEASSSLPYTYDRNCL